MINKKLIILWRCAIRILSFIATLAVFFNYSVEINAMELAAPTVAESQLSKAGKHSTLLNINDPALFSELKKQFVFADSTQEINYSDKLDFDYRYRFLFSDWLDDNRILIVSEGYQAANKLLFFDTKTHKVREHSLATVLNQYGKIDKVYGLSPDKDYLLFSIWQSKSDQQYALLAYCIADETVYSIGDFLEHQDELYKSTGETVPSDGRHYSFLPDIINRYGAFSFTSDNAIQIESAGYRPSGEQQLLTIRFPPVSEMIKHKQKGQWLKPNVQIQLSAPKQIERTLYFGHYYAALPLMFNRGQLFNVPRSNVNGIFGLEKVVEEHDAPYLFLSFHYYLDPVSLTPKFNAVGNGVSSMSTEEQARYTGLLLADKETFALKKVLVHGVGVQHKYKRKGHYLLSSIYSDKKENYLVMWDINTLQAVVRFKTENKTNYIENLFFDDKYQQIIAVHSNPAKLFVWDYDVSWQ